MGILIQDIIIPESFSECPEWIGYFNKLQEKFGEDNARTLWVRTWQANGSTSCTTNPDFNDFLKKHNIDVSNAVTRAVSDISEIGSNVLGIGKNLTKVLSIGIPTVLVLVVAAILYMLFRTAKDVTVSDVANLTPQGRIANLVK